MHMYIQVYPSKQLGKQFLRLSSHLCDLFILRLLLQTSCCSKESAAKISCIINVRWTFKRHKNGKHLTLDGITWINETCKDDFNDSCLGHSTWHEWHQVRLRSTPLNSWICWISPLIGKPLSKALSRRPQAREIRWSVWGWTLGRNFWAGLGKDDHKIQ